MKLRINKKGCICRPDGTVLGNPSSDGSIRRGKVMTGCFDLETGIVYDIKDNELGTVDLKALGIKLPEIEKKSEDSRSVDKLKPVKKVIEEPKSDSEYVPGLDSHLIVTGKLTRIIYHTIHNTDINKDNGNRINVPVSLAVEDKVLQRVNKLLGSEFINWEQLTAKGDFSKVSDDVLWKLYTKLDWYVFIKFQKVRFEKMSQDMRNNIYNYMKKYKPGDYRALNI